MVAMAISSAHESVEVTDPRLASIGILPNISRQVE
jgi:hypothetical protein